MRNHKVLVGMSVFALWLMLGTLAAFQRGYFRAQVLRPHSQVLRGPGRPGELRRSPHTENEEQLPLLERRRQLRLNVRLRPSERFHRLRRSHTARRRGRHRMPS